MNIEPLGPVVSPVVNLAIHSTFLREWPLIRDGVVLGQYQIRLITPHDRAGVLDLFEHLSAKSRYFRFAHAISTLPEDLLNDIIYATKVDNLALVAMIKNPNGTETFGGIARYIKDVNGNKAEFSLSVNDDHHHEGIGANLMRSILDCATLNNLTAIYGYINKKNADMLSLMRYLNFQISTSEEDRQSFIAQHSCSSNQLR
jgi:acetyltransferase